MAASSAPAQAWVQAGLGLLFPIACAHCGTALSSAASALPLCARCQPRLLGTTRPYCQRCGESLPAEPSATAEPKIQPEPSRQTCRRCRGKRFQFDAVARLGLYTGPLRLAVLRTKDAREAPLAAALANLLANAVAEQVAQWQIDSLVPVPMHWWRRCTRGMNAPELLAEQLASRFHLPLRNYWLWRQRSTLPQGDLKPGERRRNVRDAFAIRPWLSLAGRRILLVDDILTTGATCHEAARALKRAGAAFVGVAVVARAEVEAG